jgi:septal ring factor EnvC (AmiA/AmiB activator)
VEGMYSRTTISKSLGEQKSMCASLQKMISRQTVELEECKELVNREVKLRKKLEDSVVDKDSEIERLKLKGHHVDQELRRLLAVIEVGYFTCIYVLVGLYFFSSFFK